MTIDKPDNGNQHAFPIMSFNGMEHHSGLSKREHFAGLAMQGMLADASRMDRASIPEIAVRYADELLKQLEK